MDFQEPARTFSFHAEGALSYDALLFIPGAQPFDLYSKDYEKGLALYTSNVLIQEKCSDLLPDYYNFVRGVVDSPDVTLNISRETLQQNSQLRAIARRVEKKIHTELCDMRDNDREAYDAFFDHFGRGLKFGIYNSYGSKAADLGQLLLFWSTREEKLVTLDEYAAAMPAGQDKIYYAAGESRDRLAKMPVVKSALDHGYDVLLCTQDVDEFMFRVMPSWHQDAVAGDSEHKGTEERDLEFASVSAADLDLATDEEKEQAEKAGAGNEELLSELRDALGDKVVDVKVAAGLGSAPARVAAEGPVSLEMDRTRRDRDPRRRMPPRPSACSSSTPHIPCTASSWPRRRRATPIASSSTAASSTTRRFSSRAAHRRPRRVPKEGSHRAHVA